MTLGNISLFKAFGGKIGYLSNRQQIVAQNIANADTPNYRARDLTEVDFGRVLTKVTKDNSVRLASTRPGHMPSSTEIPMGRNKEQKEFYEVAPGENAVVLEEQMIKSNEISLDHQLMTNLMRKNVGLIRMALGNAGNN